MIGLLKQLWISEAVGLQGGADVFVEQCRFPSAGKLRWTPKAGTSAQASGSAGGEASTALGCDAGTAYREVEEAPIRL